MQTILHAGATGLVGQLVLQRLLADVRVARVVTPTRRSLGVAHPRLFAPVVDFDALPEDAPWWRVDAVVCTLGTTLARAGSREAFRHVDFDYPLAVARLAHAHGAKTFALNSAMGADPRSRVFYSRVKGELEQALSQVGFDALALVRPGLIDGERTERRTGEALALAASRALRPVLPRAWRPSRAARIADALVEAALAPRAGVTTVEAAALA
jgi:uncharacterized protein YbjT (DUF2867 family)